MRVIARIKNMDEVKAKLKEAFKQYPEETMQALQKLGYMIEAQAVKNIVDAGHSNTGELAAKHKVTRTLNRVEINFFAKHAAWAHEGTAPHMPPIEPLKEWATRKFSLSDEEEINAVAWGTAIIISRFGTKPMKFLENAVDELRPQILDELKSIIRSEVGG